MICRRKESNTFCWTSRFLTYSVVFQIEQKFEKTSIAFKLCQSFPSTRTFIVENNFVDICIFQPPVAQKLNKAKLRNFVEASSIKEAVKIIHGECFHISEKCAL